MTQENQSAHILFVDNSRTTRATMAKILQEKGYRVASVASGSEAIDLIKSNDYKLVIMDFFMPKMNGYEAAKIIRGLPENKNKIPIIALTGSQDPKNEAISKQSGMNELIIKSEDHQDLFQAIKKYIQL